MKINNHIYNKILSKCSSISTEAGGIIGGNNGIVTIFYFDKGIERNIPGYYIPNVDLFNLHLSKWQKRNIDFYGIIHSHKNDYENLSSSDKNYIRAIMKAMPNEICFLYFPIVHNNVISSYKAIRNYDEIFISNEEIIQI